jgi:hypothetical protein
MKIENITDSKVSNSSSLEETINQMTEFEKSKEIKFQSYVISVNNDSIENSFSHNSNSLKYKLRRESVINDLIPSFSKICDVKIFDAIKPIDFEFIDNDKVKYKDILYKRGIDKNYGTYCNEFQTALSIGFLELYKKSFFENTSLLLMEDDAVLPESNLLNIYNSIYDFLNIEEPALLYLQSECPWMEGLPIRVFSQGTLLEHSQHLCKIEHSWYDIAGTACFMINPSGSKKMIELIEIVGLGAADQLTTLAMLNKFLTVYISKDHRNMALLNKNLQ